MAHDERDGNAADEQLHREYLARLSRELRRAEARVRRLRRALLAVKWLAHFEDDAHNAPEPVRAVRRLKARPVDGNAPVGPTQVGTARKILKEHGGPMHIAQIAEAVQQRAFPNESVESIRKSLVRTMNRKAEKGKLFIRTGPSTFDLIDRTKARAE